jgi:hypothetical protein
MSQPELVTHVARILDSLSIEFMLTGSWASSVQGESRLTHDIDLLVDLRAIDNPRLVEAFPPPRFYVSELAVQDAVRNRSQFNVLTTGEGDKIDFWLLSDEPFDRSRFARRRRIPLFGQEIPISTPEDTILAKLRWARLLGGSSKQETDALRVYEYQLDGLDLAYIERWVADLGVNEEWTRLKAVAKPMP